MSWTGVYGLGRSSPQGGRGVPAPAERVGFGVLPAYTPGRELSREQPHFGDGGGSLSS
jgi:hypothetical protein